MPRGAFMPTAAADIKTVHERRPRSDRATEKGMSQIKFSSSCRQRVKNASEDGGIIYVHQTQAWPDAPNADDLCPSATRGYYFCVLQAAQVESVYLASPRSYIRCHLSYDRCQGAEFELEAGQRSLNSRRIGGLGCLTGRCKV
eukprot:6180584-Pleurochrysis_carterae.AAC.1